jgi:hypothetical protein
VSHRGSPSVVAAQNRRRVALFVGVTALLLAAVGLTGVLLLRRTAPPGPRDAVEAWLTAVKADDTQRLGTLTCAAFAEGSLEPEQAHSVAWTLTGETVTDPSAQVTAEVTYTVEGYLQRDTWTFDLVHEGDVWRLCGRAVTLTEPDTPRTAFVHWMAAAQAGDLAAVQSVTCHGRAAEITADEVGTGERTSLTYEISDVHRVDEARAEVAFTVRVQRNGGPVSFDERWVFVDEEGAWKACGPA